MRGRSPGRSRDRTHSPQAGERDRACESTVRSVRTGVSPLLLFISTDPLRSPQQAYAPASRCYAASSSSRVTPHGAGQARATGSILLAFKSGASCRVSDMGRTVGVHAGIVSAYPPSWYW